MPTRRVSPLFWGFLNFFGLMCQNFVLLGGGGYVLLFEICEKRPFQKCMGLGLAGNSAMHGTEQCMGDC